MPPRRKQKCSMCNATSTSAWRKTEDKKSLCNSCFLKPVSSITNNANVTEDVNVKIDAKAGQTKMSSRRKPKCDICKTTSSAMWQKSKDMKDLCNSCFLYPPSTSANNSKVKNDASAEIKTILKKKCTNGKAEATVKNDTNCKNGSNVSNILSDDDPYGFNFRKSTRAKSSRYTPLHRPGQSKSNNLKAKSRRNIFKKVCFKSPTAVSTPVTAEAFFFNGQYYQIGDVVSCIDFKNKTYYAQIRGLMQDQYGEKSAVITWLLPTTLSPKPEDRFDPRTYVAGPDDDIPRKMECFEFICHAPVEYFKPRTSPYPVLQVKPESGFIWTTVGRRIENSLVISREKLLGASSS